MQRTSEQGPASTATVQIFKSVRLPVESAPDSPFGHAVRVGVFGSQRGARSLRAIQTRSLRMSVFKYDLSI